MYLPLNVNSKSRRESDPRNEWDAPASDFGYREVASDVALELSRLLVQAGVPVMSDDMILKGLLSGTPTLDPAGDTKNVGNKNSLDLIQSENDFIDAYNALTRSTPLPNVDDLPENTVVRPVKQPKRDTYDVIENESHSNIINTTSLSNINDNEQIHRTENFMTVTNDQINTLTNIQDIQNEPLGNINGYSQEDSITVLSPIGQESAPRAEKEIANSSPNHSKSQINTPEENIPLNKNMENTLKNNFEEPLSNAPIIVSPIDVNMRIQSIPGKDQSVNQGQEKATNFNDIVGNTQRLIKQMKDEINSDINYSSNISQSEADSSNESDISSDHESSYSDTEDKETDDLTSNESEISGSENEARHLQERRPTIIHRNSSEENDQFEEAMDHIEDQMEDFRNTNIEILDSIARSLQEEHTISVEVNDRATINNKRQDLNNNVFIEVNSFEEIYAEINSNNNKERNTPTTTVEKINETLKNNAPGQPEAPKLNITKQLITFSNFEIVTPTKLTVSENNQTAFNAVVEDVEENFNESDKNALNVTENEKISNDNLNNDFASATETVFISSDEDDSLASIDSNVTPNDELVFASNVNKSPLNKATTESEYNIEQNIVIENVDNQSITVEDIVEENNTPDNTKHINNTEYGIAIENIIEQNTITENLPEQNLVIENIPEQNIKVENTSGINISSESNIEQNIESITRIEQENKMDVIDSPSKILLLTDNVDDSKATTPNDQKRNLTEKSPPRFQTDSSSNKTLTTNKSNIPKLVKVVQNNKQKGDKTSPKVAASKVPVRRASLKQYPAPTPPKAHFGNVQSGHVKQLQTRLFNNKFPKTVVNVPDVVDVKPSTSTLHKKKPAPPPPNQEPKKSTPTNVSPPKEKKDNFFRESCRTEDEWTESEAEDGPPPARRESEEPNRPPSPPLPVTVRRVSGQIIDLAKVRLPEGSPEVKYPLLN